MALVRPFAPLSLSLLSPGLKSGSLSRRPPSQLSFEPVSRLIEPTQTKWVSAPAVSALGSSGDDDVDAADAAPFCATSVARAASLFSSRGARVLCCSSAKSEHAARQATTMNASCERDVENERIRDLKTGSRAMVTPTLV